MLSVELEAEEVDIKDTSANCLTNMASNPEFSKPVKEIEKILLQRTYRLRLSKNSSMLVRGVVLRWRVRQPTSLFLIPGLVKDYCEPLGGCWVVDIPFAELWQWTATAFFLQNQEPQGWQSFHDKIFAYYGINIYLVVARYLYLGKYLSESKTSDKDINGGRFK